MNQLLVLFDPLLLGLELVLKLIVLMVFGMKPSLVGLLTLEVDLLAEIGDFCLLIPNKIVFLV
jgi:hypothetical protein